MLKRVGFGRYELVSAPPAAPRRSERAGVMADCGAMSTALAKPEPQRNDHLLSMARGKPCLLRVPGVCNFNPETTVAAHSNLLIHGKGRGRKADDCYSVWGCSSCHTWLDTSSFAPQAEKEAAFMAALFAQFDEWRAITNNNHAAPKDRAASLWALNRVAIASPSEEEMP